MKKAGQISIFMIFAIMIFLIGWIYFSQAGEKGKVRALEHSSLVLDKQAIGNYMNECLKSLGENSLILFGLQGGNVEISKTDKSPALLVNTFYRYGKNTMPSIEQLEKVYSEYIRQNAYSCPESLDYPGYKITYGSIEVNTKFYNDVVVLNINYPITLKSKESEINLQKFGYVYPVRMGYIYNISQGIVNKFVEAPDIIEYSYFNKFENDSFFIIPYNKNLFVILIRDGESNIRNNEYTFAFGLVFNDVKSNNIISGINSLLA